MPAYTDIQSGLVPDGPPRLIAPFRDFGIYDIYVIKQDYLVQANNFTHAPLASGQPNDIKWSEDPNFVLVDETDPEPEIANYARITRTFAKVPPTLTIDDDGVFSYTYPGVVYYFLTWMWIDAPDQQPTSDPYGSPPSGDGTRSGRWVLVLDGAVLREPYTTQTNSKLVREFVLSAQSPEPPEPFRVKNTAPVIIRTSEMTSSVVLFGQPFTNLAVVDNYIWGGTIVNTTNPTMETYAEWVQNGTEIVAETGVKRWMGNIWEIWQRKVKAL